MVVTRSDQPGGAQVHVRDLALALRERGCQVIVLAGGAGPLEEDLRARGLPTVRLRHLGRPLTPVGDARAFLELRSALRRLTPDLVALHSSKAGWLGRLAAASLGLPAVYTAHGWSFAPGTPAAAFNRLAEALASRLPAAVIAVSRADRDLARRLLGCRVECIPNGIPDDPGRADPSRQPPLLLMAARFAPQKDHDLLLRALARLRHRPWSLVLAGEGPGRDQVQRRVRELGLEDRVRLPGFLPDPGFCQAQVAVLASRWEGLPLSVLEAMRAGLPVVASDVGGVGEAVRSGETGILVPPGDEGALARALETLLDDPDLRLRLGRAGRLRYQQHFRHETMVERTLEVYRRVARRRLTLLVTCLEGGGAQQVVHDLATRMPPQRWEVRVAALRHPSAGEPRQQAALEAAGIPVLPVGVRHPLDLLGAWRLARHLVTFRPHILHAHLFHAHLAARVLGRLCGVPRIVCTHHEVERRHRPFRPLLERLTAGLDDASVAVSAAVESHARIRLGARRLRRIPNGIDLERWAPRSRPPGRLGLPEGAEVVGALGRLHVQKGLDVLLAAFACLRERRPGALLVLAGEGSEEARLRSLAPPGTVFLGYCGDGPGFLASLDVLAMPSRWEGYGLVLAQALAMGVPVVCSSVDSLPEVAGGAARLVPPERPDLLAGALEEVLDSREMRDAMRLRGLARARDLDVRTCVAGHLALYEELCGQPVTRRGCAAPGSTWTS